MLYILMLNLIYPAVLGTIFYSLLQNIFNSSEWLFDRVEFFKIVFSMGIVCHYCVDFLYIFSFEVYGRFAFFVDLTVVVLLYRASAALVALSGPDYKTFFFCFLLIYMTFLPHEIMIWQRYKKAGDHQRMKAHQWMLIHEAVSCSLFVIFILYPRIAGSTFGALSIFAISLDYALILRERTRYHKII